jgi:hypothetical protein
MISRIARNVIICFGWMGLFMVPQLTHAALVVSEIMYDPPGSNAGHQWLEVLNTGPEVIDLGTKDTRLFDAAGNHLLKVADAGDSTLQLQVGSVAVVAQNPMQFKNDYPSFKGMLL